MKTHEFSQPDSGGEPAFKPVWVTIPGGEDGQGGIARQMLYFRDAAARTSPEFPLKFLQTRSTTGPWFGVWLHSWLQFSLAALTGRAGLLHLNISSNASFWRKYSFFLVARLLRVPVAAHLHSGAFADFYDSGGALRKACIRHMFTRSARVLILGEYWRSFMQDTLGVQPEKIIVQYNAVAGPAQPVQRAFDGEVKLLFLAQLNAKKGADDLLNALSDTELRALPWQLVMAGGGDVKAYHEKVRAAGLEDKITLPGWAGPEEVERLCRESHVMVLPSHVENQPLTLLEAMAHSMVIASTRAGTIPEIIRDGETGLLTDAKDVNGLKNHLLNIVNNYPAFASIAGNARKDYETKHKPEYFAESVLNLYKNIFKNG